MHQLAIALQKKGFTISGSDDEIYDPSRSLLADHDLLPNEMGWFPEKISQDLDCIILGMHARKDNPELLKAIDLGIKVYSYPEYIYEFSKNKKRVVIAGSHGKTTMTSALMHILNSVQMDFDYLVGARLKGFDSSVKLSDAPIMIMEGDEYLSSPIHPAPKIHYYKPDLALLSGIAWDHMNVFPTFDNYLGQFEQFLDLFSENGRLIYNTEDDNICDIVSRSRNLHLIPYKTPKYLQKDGSFSLIQKKDGKESEIPLKVFGAHNMENLEGVRIICNELGIEDETFYRAIQTFEGASKRLDCLLEDEKTMIFRDFAHAPSKAKATCSAVKSLFPNRKMVAVFELHTYSSLNKDFLPEYKESMDAADEAIVFFSRHTLKIKKLPDLEVDQIKKAFGRADLKVYDDNEKLKAHLKSTDWNDCNLLMMSSGTFGGFKNDEIVRIVENAKS